MTLSAYPDDQSGAPVKAEDMYKLVPGEVPPDGPPDGPRPAPKYHRPMKINNGYSSSFQEFRSGHFHAGFDLRTHQKTGFPVHAIADGYIYKIRMVRRGSGRGLYLKHDDGYTSIYFHLERFEKSLEDLLRRVQRQKGKRYVGNYFLKQPLRFKRGQVIAYSGETGAGFPHLHLEIRDKNYVAVNPFPLVDFPGRDRAGPVLKKLLLRSVGDSLINGRVGETTVSLRKSSDGFYVSREPLVITGDFDLVLAAHDVSDSGRPVAPYSISVFIDDVNYFDLSFDRFQRDDNNQLGFVYDMFHSNSGSYYFNLFSQRGFRLEKAATPMGRVLEGLEPGKHHIRILVKDNFNNSAVGVIPFYKIPPPGFEITGTGNSETSGQFYLDIGHLESQPPPAGQIKISVYDGVHQKISSGGLDYHRITSEKPFLMKGLSPRSSYIDFDFYVHDVPYFKRRSLVDPGHLAGMTDIDTDIFVNRDDIFVKILEPRLSVDNIDLTVFQGNDRQQVSPRGSGEGIYFCFKPLNTHGRVRLRFSLLDRGQKRVEIEKILDLVVLKNGLKQSVADGEFSAVFHTRSVYEPRVLRVEERHYASKFPVLSRQISLGPYHFPFLDTVHYRFKKQLPRPEQVAVFKYNFKRGTWGARYTVYDAGSATYRCTVRSSGVFALMRDVFPPRLWLLKPASRFKSKLRRLAVKITDRGKGVNDGSIKTWINGVLYCRGYDCDFDPDWGTLTVDAGNLRVGENTLKVEVRDYAGHRVSKTFTIHLQ